MQFFDTHAHIGLIYDDPIDQLRVVQDARRAGVTRIISICNSLRDFEQRYADFKSIPQVFHAVGISPSEVMNPGNDWVQVVEKSLKLPNVVALGETGLDYYKKFGSKNAQIELFITQLEIANKMDVPVIIHNRNAGKDILEILSHRMPSCGAVFHCYSENLSYAKSALNYNVYFSFAGNLTYRSTRDLHETAMYLPVDRMLVESEAPFMVPAEFRNKRNVPSYITSTVKFLADLRDMDYEEMVDQLWKNSCRFFKLPE